MKRPSIPWKWLLIPVIVIVLIAVALSTNTGPSKRLSVTFIGFTNHLTTFHDSWLAAFVISNECNRDLQFASDGVDVNADGTWLRREYFSYHTVDPRVVHFGGSLKPRESTQVYMLVETGANTWRLPVVSWAPSKMDELRFRAVANIQAIRNRQPLPGFKGTYEWTHTARTNFSREITTEFNPHSSPSSPELR